MRMVIDVALRLRLLYARRRRAAHDVNSRSRVNHGLGMLRAGGQGRGRLERDSAER